MNNKLLISIALSFTGLNPAVADEWDWEVTPYLWASGISGGVAVGSIEADISASFEDIVNVLQGGALLRFEGMSGQNGVFGDTFDL